MSVRASRCQSACGSRTESRRGSRCPSRRGSQGNLAQTMVQSARPGFQVNCRSGCTVCPPPPCQKPPCPLGIYVERTKSLKPAVEFVPSCAKMDGLSSYREFFYPKCGDRTKSFKPATMIDPSCAKMDGMTTYREFYYPKCGLRTQSFKPATLVDFSCAKMDGVTTYKNDYVGGQTERVKSLKPLTQFDPSCAKMDGLTTYRMNYIPYCPRELGRPDSYRRLNDVDFSCAPFDGMTTYQGDFWCKPIVRVQSLKPAIRGAFSDAPFADRTTYRNDFHPFHFDRNCGGRGPCMPQTFGQEVSPLLFCANTADCIQEPEVTTNPQQTSTADAQIGMGGDTGGMNCAPPCCPAMDSAENRMEGEA